MSSQLQSDLNSLLADYMVFYQKLRNYHWNVKGPMFFNLHAKFEEMYTDAALKVDELAEAVAALGGKPVSTLKGQLELARLKEDHGDPEAIQMVKNIVADMESLNAHLRTGVEAAADHTATANLLEEIADGQEKTAWMLRAYLG